MPVSNNDLLKEIRAMGARFDMVTGRLDNVDERLNNNFSDVNNRCNQIDVSLSTFKSETKQELAKLSERINALDINKSDAETVVDLLVKGIPYADGENLQETISAISRVIQFDDEESIINIHRLKSKSSVENDMKAMPVILKFSSQSTRRKFHGKYFAFTKTDTLKLSHIGLGDDERIFIKENLNKHKLDLLKRAKKLKKNGKIAAAYSYNGKICVYHHKSDKKFDILSVVEDLKKYE